MDDKPGGLLSRWETPNAPYDWRWPSRYCLTVAILAGAVFLVLVATGSLPLSIHLSRGEIWAAWIVVVCAVVWALVIARELGKLILAGAALWGGYELLAKITASLRGFEELVTLGFFIGGLCLYDARKEIKALRGEIAHLRGVGRSD